jgi:hypothetical protein
VRHRQRLKTDEKDAATIADLVAQGQYVAFPLSGPALRRAPPPSECSRAALRGALASDGQPAASDMTRWSYADRSRAVLLVRLENLGVSSRRAKCARRPSQH